METNFILNMISKFKVLWYAILGFCYKLFVDIRILRVPSLAQTNRKVGNRIIVSMTSYGRRISSSVVYYSIVSVLRQSVQPDKVTLWIDKTRWTEELLPRKLKSLIPKGVEYKFCKDLRSYTKLIPALQEYPNDIIITFDDDIIYPRNTIQQLYDEYQKHPDSICCLNPLEVRVIDGIPGKYETWTFCANNVENNVKIFPCGVEGVLYPPHSLSEEVKDENLFKALCPLADDIWFWFSGCRNNTKRIGIRKTKTAYSFDALYQYFHKGSALTHTNRFEHANDKQFKNVFEHYGVIINDEGELIQICEPFSKSQH